MEKLLQSTESSPRAADASVFIGKPILVDGQLWELVHQENHERLLNACVHMYVVQPVMVLICTM